MTDQERIDELEQRVADLEYALAGTMISLSARDHGVTNMELVKAMRASKLIKFVITFDDEHIMMVQPEVKDA